MTNSKPQKAHIFQLVRRGALELFSVFTAILLALWVDQWYENHQRQQRIELAMKSVTAELAVNHQSLLKAHEFQTETLAKIRNYAKKNEELTEAQASEFLTEMYQRSMFRPVELLDTGWQVLMQSQLLNYMPYDRVLTYAHHYKMQQTIVERQNMQMQTMDDFRINSDSSKALLNLYYNTVNEIWWGEKRLLNSFAKVGLDAKEKTAKEP